MGDERAERLAADRGRQRGADRSPSGPAPARVAVQTLRANRSAPSAPGLLALQRAAGNRATSALLQRAPGAAAPAKAAGNPEDYADLLTGVSHLLTVVQQENVDNTDAVVPLNLKQTNEKQRADLGAVTFGRHLTKPHRALVEKLRATLIQARTETPGSARTAVTMWQSIQGDLGQVFASAPRFVDGDVGSIQQDFQRIGTQLIYGGAYAEAHGAALGSGGLTEPSSAMDVDGFKAAAEGFEELYKFAKKGQELAGDDAIAAVIAHGPVDPKMAKAILELVKSPGEIREKLKEFKEQGLIGKAVTIAEIADKTRVIATAITEISLKILKTYSTKAAAVAVEGGAKELAEHWSKIGEWASERLEVVEKVGKVVGKVAIIVGVVVSAVKIIDLIRQGKWGEALKEAGTTVATLLAGTAGAGGAAMIGGIVVVVAGEIEALSGAAAMMHFARKANARDAAWSFIDVCTGAANLEARDLVADATLLGEAKNEEERKIIEKNLTSYTRYWMRDLGVLRSQLLDSRASQLGGQPQLQAALGPAAVQILQNPSSWGGSWQAMAEQVRVIFAGAGSMAEYVAKNFPKAEKSDEKEGGEGGKKEGGGE